MPELKSYLPEERRQQLMKAGGMNLVYIAESGAADDAGDDEAGWGWLSKARLTAANLRKIKRWYGADFIRKWGFDTTEADKEMGVDWLDR